MAFGSSGKVKELEQALAQKDNDLKMNEKRFAALEEEMKKKDELIKNLNRELDKCRSVLTPARPLSTHLDDKMLATAAGAAPTKVVVRARTDGISSAPVNQTAEPLKKHAKSEQSKNLIRKGLKANEFLTKFESGQVSLWCTKFCKTSMPNLPKRF